MVKGMGYGNWEEDERIQYGVTEWLETEINIESLKDFVDKPDLIVHCAGSAVVGESFNNPYIDFQANVSTTLNVLEYIRLYSPHTRLVYPSSAGVYGKAAELPISEDSQLNPVSPYGFHKKIAEELCLSYAKNYGLSISIVRLFSVYGDGLKKQIFWDACLKASKGNSEFFGTGEETRDFIHIDDVTRLLYIAGENAEQGVCLINGGFGIQVKIRDVLSQLFKELKCNKDIVFNSVYRAGDPMHYQADITKANLLGWYPNVNLEQGIKKYVEWFIKETT